MKFSTTLHSRVNQSLKSFFVIAWVLLLCNSSSGQIKRNSLYAEIGGNAGIYSLNYDRLIDVNDKLKFAPRIGFSTLGLKWFAVPIEANLLYSNKENAKHFAEFGLGTTFIHYYGWNFNNEDNIPIGSVEKEKYRSRLVFIGRLGYRYQKPQGGFMYRLSLNFLYTSRNGVNPIPIPGVSLGHSF